MCPENNKGLIALLHFEEYRCGTSTMLVERGRFLQPLCDCEGHVVDLLTPDFERAVLVDRQVRPVVQTRRSLRCRAVLLVHMLGQHGQAEQHAPETNGLVKAKCGIGLAVAVLLMAFVVPMLHVAVDLLPIVVALVVPVVDVAVTLLPIVVALVVPVVDVAVTLLSIVMALIHKRAVNCGLVLHDCFSPRQI